MFSFTGPTQWNLLPYGLRHSSSKPISSDLRTNLVYLLDALCVCLCVSVIQNVCVCLRVCEVTGCSSRITATKAKKDVDQEVLLYSFLAAVLKHG